MGLRKFTQTYARYIPQIVILQLITKSLIGVVIMLLGALSNWAFASQGRVAISSGDFAFVFLCWQGWVLILATIILLYVSFALDVNAQVAFSGYDGQQPRVAAPLPVLGGRCDYHRQRGAGRAGARSLGETQRPQAHVRCD